MSLSRDGEAAVGLAIRLVRRTFVLFPREFRDRHRADAPVYFEDRARDRFRAGGVPGLMAFTLSLLRIVLPEPVVAGHQHDHPV